MGEQAPLSDRPESDDITEYGLSSEEIPRPTASTRPQGYAKVAKAVGSAVWDGEPGQKEIGDYVHPHFSHPGFGMEPGPAAATPSPTQPPQ